MSQLFTGAGVALITPFTTNNQVDYKALETIIDNQINGGMDYLVALGTTAETATLTSDEKSHKSSVDGMIPPLRLDLVPQSIHLPSLR